MDTSFARKLIESPGEATTQELFQESHAGIFWVDWREADNYIVTLVARALGSDDLRASWVDDQLFIDYGGRRTQVPLERKPGEQDITLDSLNKALEPEFEIRYVKASEGGDTLAFMVLPKAAWRELEQSHGDKLPQAFAPVDLRAPLFAHGELPADFLASVHQQMAPVHFSRLGPRLITTARAAALLAAAPPADSSRPVVEPLFGDLALTYFRDLIGNDADVTEGELEQYATTREQLRDYAVQHAEGEAWAGTSYYTNTGLAKFTSQQRIAASTIALWDGFWAATHEAEGSVVAAFPHRDVVLFTSAGDREALAVLLEAVECFGSGGEALSRQVYAWGPNGWQVFEAPEADRSFRKSQTWLAAEQGNLHAQYRIAELYQYTELYAQAVTWYRKAAERAAAVPRTSDDMFENGSAAQCNLADKYEHGLGVPQDFKQALYWYGKSAEMGNEVAQYSLGMMYLEGRGVPKDLAQARHWLEQSAARGYADAAAALQAVA